MKMLPFSLMVCLAASSSAWADGIPTVTAGDVPSHIADAASSAQSLDLAYLEFITFVTQTSDYTDPIEINQVSIFDVDDDDPYAFYVISSRY